MIICENKAADFTSCVINNDILSTDSSSKFSELMISMIGKSSGYLSVYVNWMTQDAKPHRANTPNIQVLLTDSVDVTCNISAKQAAPHYLI